nr:MULTISPECIES: DUF3006 domain-containing protein [Desulfitobacterium]
MFNLPRLLLPTGVKEGDVIFTSVAVDPEATKSRRERINNIKATLGGREYFKNGHCYWPLFNDGTCIYLTT